MANTKGIITPIKSKTERDKVVDEIRVRVEALKKYNNVEDGTMVEFEILMAIDNLATALALKGV